ncbi:MAG TPA: cytochrome c oxidase subunit I [Gammaproteobacteria bacterium]|nr:cytochrome c oxidase subunit I [Gammaproteobacteria bacterium]
MNDASTGSDEERAAQESRLVAAWRPPRGWRYFSEVNNNSVGLWYILTALCFFLFGGLLAAVMRAQLAVPENELVSASRYAQLFTLHGSVMMFLFAVPIFEALAIQILPQMTGARDLPFPRLSAFGYWCYAIGGVFVCGSIFFDVAPQGGWFMYPPLSTRWQPDLGADVWLLGLSFIEIATLAAAIELIVGVLKCRAPGMRIHLMPLYAWYMLVVAGMIVFAFPPLIVGDVMLELERAFDWPFFDARRGGDPLLWQHLFWIFGHPEVYVIFLPAIALVAMIVPTFAHAPMIGYTWIVLAAVGTGFLSFGLWVHHMFTTGLPRLSLAFFSGASLAVAIPSAVQIFCFIATVLVGRFVASVPMLFVAGALAVFVLGGLTGVMVAMVPFNFQAHDSYFIVAHLHYVLFGGMVLPVLAGIYYYLPLVAGRRLGERAGRRAFWLIFGGFNLAFLPMHLSGLLGMPRRVYTYRADIGLDELNLISTVGAAVLALGFAVFLVDLWLSLRRGGVSPRDPWRAGTLEWLPRLPLHPWGLRSVPQVDTRYPLWDRPALREEVDAGRWYLPDAEEGRRETLLTGAIDAEPLHCLRVGGPSFLPLAAAVFTGGAFILATFHAWTMSAVCAALALIVVVAWLWTGTARPPEKPAKHVGRGLVLPLYAAGTGAPGWWGMCITMLADASAFAALVFGYFYYWTIDEGFLDRAVQGTGAGCAGAAAAAMLGAWASVLCAARVNRHGHAGRGRLLLGMAALGSAIAAGCALAVPASAGLAPAAHVYDAMVWLVAGWIALHVAVGLLMVLYCLARSAARLLTPVYDADLRNTALYWHFALGQGLAALAMLALFPANA